MQGLEDISIQYIKGVGPARKKLFERLGVESVEDLLYFFPRRYEDRRHLTPIAQLKAGEWQTISGTVLSCQARRSWYTKKHVVEVVLDDGTGRLACVWFNQAYLVSYFREGKRVVCFGKADVYKNSLQMVSPEYEVLESGEDQLSLSRIVPIYPLTRGMTQRYLRKTVHACLTKYQDQLIDELPVPLRNKHRLYNIKRSIANIHFPETLEDQENAMKRVSFEEFYFFQASVIQRRLSITQKEGIPHTVSDAQALKFTQAFPFELTGAQKRVIGEIRSDMQKPSPMLRLLQGDVGSGKTLVALYGCWAAHLNGFQSCVMAPTEILARQHYENITKMIEGGALSGVRPALFISGLSAKERESTRAKIQSGGVDLVVGTHALLGEGVSFKNLSFVVIDEQHKFGVRQRALLTQKGIDPDVLIMTATPIPRTLCISLYGDLDLSVLDEMPPDRGKVTTLLFPDAQAQEAYARIRREVENGQQAYVIYPLVEESEKLDLKAARQMFRHFQKEVFKDFQVGLVHGRMKPKESREVMERFKDKKVDILVATTVVEVGVDVPSAGVMVIEHAERFGLAQLHQLRGRIGRGTREGLCILISDTEDTDGQKRLKALLSTTDGFKIAQYDLEIRGPGRYFGRHQHGLNELKVANPLTQLDILELARREAVAVTEQDPRLQRPENRYIQDIIRRRYPTYLAEVAAG